MGQGALEVLGKKNSKGGGGGSFLIFIRFLLISFSNTCQGVRLDWGRLDMGRLG
jgi:hypothetical protein